MSKFIIACPECHRYVEAKTGFFASKRIKCVCGNTFNVKTERLTSRVCPSCGNTVAYDLAEGTQATCPVCHAQLVTQMSLSQFVNFHCSKCGCDLQAHKGDKTVICPICDAVNDVQKMTALETVKDKGKPSVIRYEGDNHTLVWKHPNTNFVTGSELIVHESQEAIFFRDGEALDTFASGKYILDTDMLPKRNKYGEIAQNDESFHSEVYFVNLATLMAIKWGTSSKVRLFDPDTGIHMELGASGTFNLRVTDARRLVINLVGTTDALTQDQIFASNDGYFRTMVMNKVRANLVRAIQANHIPVLDIDAHVDTISTALRDAINVDLDRYGLTMPEFYISNIMLPEDDPNYRKMRQQYADLHLRVTDQRINNAVAKEAQDGKLMGAQTEAQLKAMGAQAEAEAELILARARAEAHKLQAEAEAHEMRIKGYTYQDETGRQVATEAVKAGAAGSDAIGTVMQTGLKIGAIQSAMNMTRNAVSDVLGASSQNGAWDCACGQTGITSNFCPSCGAKRPGTQTWNCPACGYANITTNFCPNCGVPRPTSAAWTCSCGTANITTNFCPNCGKPRP